MRNSLSVDASIWLVHQITQTAMFRDDFRRIARLRLREARELLRIGCYSGAYYLAGFAVECGLKASIASQRKRCEFPPDVNAVRKIYTHNLEDLVNSAGLKPSLLAEQAASARFKDNWTTVKDWDVFKRYQTIPKPHAKDLYSAITARTHGVMRWIRQHW